MSKTAGKNGMEQVYAIKGMHCKSWVERISRALRGIIGVTLARVSLNPPQARVVMENYVPITELQNAVRGRY